MSSGNYSVSKYSRFPEEGHYVMLGDPKCAEKMNKLRVALMLTLKIVDIDINDKAEMALMNDSLESLNKTIADFHQCICKGDCVFDRKLFEDVCKLQWD
uniref:Uncharacterized protein n=1 Tax=Panagrolaimus davidi TaxID=227884 RepID=A0A914PF86_9BILA